MSSRKKKAGAPAAASRPEKKSLESAVNSLRAQIVSQGECVRFESIVTGLARHFGVHSFPELGLRAPTDLPCLHALRELQTSIDLYLIAAVAAKSVTTLYDLEKDIATAHQAASFDALGLGPLLRHPLVIKYFAPPANLTAIPSVSTVEVVKWVKQCFQKNRNWFKASPSEVAAWICKEKGISSLSEICVYVSSFPFIRSKLAAVDKERNRVLERMKQQELEDAHKEAQFGKQSLAQVVNMIASSLFPQGLSSHEHDYAAPVCKNALIEENPASSSAPPSASEVAFSSSTKIIQFMWNRLADEYRPVAEFGKKIIDDHGHRSIFGAACILGVGHLEEDTDVATILASIYVCYTLHPRNTGIDTIMQRFGEPKSFAIVKQLQGLTKNAAKEFVTLFKIISTHAILKRIFAPGDKKTCKKRKAAYEMVIRGFFLVLSDPSLWLGMLDLKAISLVKKKDPVSQATIDAIVAKLREKIGSQQRPVDLQFLRDLETNLVTNQEGARFFEDLTDGKSLYGLLLSNTNSGWIKKKIAKDVNLNELAEISYATWINGKKKSFHKVEADSSSPSRQDIAEWVSACDGDVSQELPEDAFQSVDIISADMLLHHLMLALDPENPSPEMPTESTSETQQCSCITKLVDLETKLAISTSNPCSELVPGGYNSFNEFISRQSDADQVLRKLIDRYLHGAQKQSTDKHRTGSPQLAQSVDPADIVDFIRQKKLCEECDDDLLRKLLIEFFGLLEFDDFSEVFRRASCPSGLRGDSGMLIYNEILVVDSDLQISAGLIYSSLGEPHISTSQVVVGALGDVDRCDAVSCLSKVPDLISIQDYMHWDQVFLPTLGSLKQFLRQGHPEFLGFKFMQVYRPHGAIVKIPFGSNCNAFEVAIVSGRGRDAAAHLVAILLEHGCTSKAPMSLLADCTAKAVAALSNAFREEQTIVTILKDCLIALPELIRLAVMLPVFIHPLASLISGLPAQLIKVCKTYDEICIFERLGLAHKIPEWLEGLRQRNKPFITKLGSGVEGSEKLERTNPPPLKVFASLCSSEVANKDLADALKIAHSLPSDVHMATGAKNVTDLTPKKCQLIVEDIRRAEFGIGVDVDPQSEAGKVIAGQRLRIERAMKRLSSELYSRDTHFVMELIQNCDDNMYMTGILPTVEFTVDNSEITVSNNEVGFTEANVRAICDVGRSTKSGTQHRGYIGSKGIGFKSVLRVSHAPEVHSGNFHIRFQAKDIIVPEWIDVEDSDAPFGKAKGWPWTTVIRLPLKDDIRETGLQRLASQFCDIDSSLLLFLNRIRCIVVDDRITHRRRKMQRFDRSDGFVDIETETHVNENRTHAKSAATATTEMTSTSITRYYVGRKQLDCRSFRRGSVDTTDLCVAFALPETGSNVRSIGPQPIFSYLPLRLEGFRFIVQGDFVVPSSRETVDHDSAWNAYLREQIPSLVVDTIVRFVQTYWQPENNNNNTGDSVNFGFLAQFFYDYAPLAGEVAGYFRPVVQAIVNEFRERQFIPVQLSSFTDDINETVGWTRPGQSIIVPEWASKIVTKDVLKKMDLFAVHPDLQCTPAFLDTVGVRKINPQFLVDMARFVLYSELEGICDVGNWIIDWMLVLAHMCFEATNGFFTENVDNILSQLRKLPIFQLISGARTSLEEGPIFFEPSLALTLSARNGRSNKGKYTLPYAMFDAVRILQFEKYVEAALEKQQNYDVPKKGADLSTLVRFLAKLGVREVSEHGIIEAVILPDFEKGCVCDPHQAIQYLEYVKDHIAHCVSCSRITAADSCTNAADSGSIVGRVRLAACVPTDEGMHPIVSKDGRTIYIDYDENNGGGVRFGRIKELFGGSNDPNCLDFMVLDLKPFQLSGASSAKDWIDFLTRRMGMSTTFVIQTKSGQLQCADLEKCLRCLVAGNIQKNSETVQQEMMDLLGSIMICLDSMWDNTISFQTLGHCGEHTNTNSLMVLLKTLEWIPTTCHTLAKPDTIFISSPQVNCLLDDLVLYPLYIPRNDAFIQAMGFKRSANADDVRQVLEELSAAAAADAHGFIYTSVELMSGMYRFLYHQGWEHLKILVDGKSPFIFCPAWHLEREHALPIDQKVPGWLFRTNEVSWHDPSNALQLGDERIPLLQFVYGSLYRMHEIFEALGVLRIPSFGQYMSILCQLSAQASDQHWIHAKSIFVVLSKMISSRGITINEIETWREKIKTLAVFPSHRGSWVRCNEGLYINDNVELSELYFESDSSVHLLKLSDDACTAVSETTLQSVAHFLHEIAQIPLLSWAVNVQVLPNGSYFGTQLESIVREAVPYLQRYLYYRHSVSYSQLEKDGIAQRLAHTFVAITDRLEAVYTLQGRVTTRTLGCMLQENTLFVAASHMKKFADLYKEFAKIFMYPLSRNVEGYSKSGEFAMETNIPSIPVFEITHFLLCITTMITTRDETGEIESHMVNELNIPALPEGQNPWRIPDCTGGGAFVNNLLPPMSKVPDTEGLPSLEEMWKFGYRERPRPTTTNSPNEAWNLQVQNFSPPKTLPAKGDVTGVVTGDATGVVTGDATGVVTGVATGVATGDVKVDIKVNFLSVTDSVTIGRDIVVPALDSLREFSHETDIIGRFGELLVFRFLQSQSILDLDARWIWLNEKVESFQCYDIVRQRLSSSIETNPVDTFVEVKTTSMNDKHIFQISLAELRFALSAKKNYDIYRVYNVGPALSISADDNKEASDVPFLMPRILHLHNVAEQLQTGAIQLWMSL